MNTENTPLQTSGTPENKKRRGFRLFKRATNGRIIDPADPEWRDRPYNFKFQYHGQSYLRCLETTDATEAQRRAKLKAKEIKEGVQRSDYDRIDRTKLRQVTVADLQQLFDTYLTSPVDASPSTRAQNVNALKSIYTAARTAPATWTSIAITEINGQLGRKWFEAITQRVQAQTDQRAQASLKQSANSRYVQAKSLFTPKALAAYKDAGVHHPSLEEFAGVFDTHRFTRLPSTDYNPPSDDIIQRTLAAWEQITDRNLFLAVGHELAFGLRKAEIAQARWSWWTVRQGYPVLDGQATVKAGTGLVQVRALDPFFNTLRSRIEAEHWRTHPDDYIITGSPTYRSDDIFRIVSEWMRREGWETKKTNHALRAYSGSQIAMKFGIYQAQTWLRHSTVKVTEDNYSHFIKRFKLADPDQLPIHWATVQTTPIIRVLPAATA